MYLLNLKSSIKLHNYTYKIYNNNVHIQTDMLGIAKYNLLN